MRFTKMHGIGNDYVYVNCFDQTVDHPEQWARTLSDRHFGIGSDGLILILPSAQADVRMRMFNADGTEGEMCGNGVRCVAKYACEHNLVESRPCVKPHLLELLKSALDDARDHREITVQTGRGVLTLALALINDKVQYVCVDMGEPLLLPGDIPVNVVGQQAVGVPLSIQNQNLLMTCVSMGNPHVVFFCPDVQTVDLEHIGPLIENHRLFPQRTNVHFAQVIAPDEVKIRTWERGSGITLACGTGACAVCVAGTLASKTKRRLTAHLPGGDLQLHWNDQDNHVYMVGPAVELFSGDWTAA
ncbi:MAG: diaminopimelate epimerase [Phycisphaerae bacterium SM23_30]|nr:MAG: diaminopimelate epimerase [Phycisphaerae bacterium SM23_30]